MPKRGFAEYLGEDGNNASFKRRATQAKRVAEKFHHHKKILSRALKTAKGFERQKLGRRRKTALRDNEAEVARIDSEVEALKALDLNQTAEDYLCKIIQKDKALSANEDLARYVAGHARDRPSQATVNVTARLYNSNPIKEAAGEVLQALRLVLDIKSTKKTSKGGTREKNSTDAQERVDVVDTPTRQHMSVGLKGGVLDKDDMLVARTGDKDAGGEDEGVYSDASSMVEDHGRDRLASPSEDEDDLGDTGRVPHELSPSISSDEQEEMSREAKAKRARTAAPVASTTFLPSLSLGGYWSGSESEPEDDVKEVAPRKNRRGQRARQQIWEMKFGQKAKHLQTIKKIDKKRGDGWDARRGAQATNDNGARRGGGGVNGGGFASGGNATAVVPRKGRGAATTAPEAGPGKSNGKGLGEMHPSWIAAKKAKEEKQTAAFTGSRVTFS